MKHRSELTERRQKKWKTCSPRVLLYFLQTCMQSRELLTCLSVEDLTSVFKIPQVDDLEQLDDYLGELLKQNADFFGMLILSSARTNTTEDGFIDFLEFIAAINLVIRGKIDQKLKWYFKLYDADGNGCIDKKELLSIFTAIQAISGQTDMSAEEFTNMVFQKIDVNNDGELTLEEFITGVERDGNLMELITKSFDLSNVLKVIQNGRRHSI
ncbi:guanylyl cyclase-activating protein 3 [Dromaius novaehollandiae]|uniref:Guanylate cyclase activator 1C n=1 Tax=Dromaius novaehollandiae TaxID=8790 RepID=A0A8C4J6V5_DRONO|nr:guanylyl cyclase-activating protein 3 isoform X1 [Dromaius novaehollandiae]